MTQPDTRTSPRDSRNTSKKGALHQGEGWSIPVTLGVILVCAGVFFALVAHGISTLATIGY